MVVIGFGFLAFGSLGLLDARLVVQAVNVLGENRVIVLRVLIYCPSLLLGLVIQQLLAQILYRVLIPAIPFMEDTLIYLFHFQVL